MVLADTSVWVEHLRSNSATLADLLDRGQVLTHPLVIGELACGTLRQRATVLQLLSRLPAAPVATDAEALAFIELHTIMGRGIGYVHVHLVASAALAPECQLWTLDKRLAAVAGSSKLRYSAH